MGFQTRLSIVQKLISFHEDHETVFFPEKPSWVTKVKDKNCTCNKTFDKLYIFAIVSRQTEIGIAVGVTGSSLSTLQLGPEHTLEI